MATGAGRLHCTWCGEVVTGGRRFCAACGKPVVEPEVVNEDEDDEDDEEDYDDLDYTSTPGVTRSYYRAPRQSTAGLNTEPERSQSLLAKLGGGLAAVVVIPLGLIVMVVSTALPILVVVALFMGPGDTWDMVKQWVPGSGGENSSCAGFDQWYRESNQRVGRLTESMEAAGDVQSASPEELRSLAQDHDIAATEQRQSNPPPEAEILNGYMVGGFESMADMVWASLGDNESAARSSASELYDLSLVAEEEDKRVREVCG